MSDATEVKTRDRSPSYPAIPLQTALERLVAFETHFKRQPAPIAKIGAAWGLREGNGDADRYAAALRSFGLVEYRNAPVGRQVVLTDDGRTYLRAQQDSIKREVSKRAALRPKMIRQFWSAWGVDRPADDACLDQLILDNGFSDRGARSFLRVYDATISFAGLSDSDKLSATEGEESSEDVLAVEAREPPPILTPALPPAPPNRRQTGEISLMHGERELTTGLLSRGASFRLIVSGQIGEREIERLIRKLELDKEYLSDVASGADAKPESGET